MSRKRATVELFEEIRREYEYGAGSVKGVARKLGVHRRLVREALADAIPKPKREAKRPTPAIGPAMEFIDQVLITDRKAPRKQRHTAHRVYTRLRTEMPDHRVAESSVRRYVRRRKAELGWKHEEAFVPQADVRSCRVNPIPSHRRRSAPRGSRWSRAAGPRRPSP